MISQYKLLFSTIKNEKCSSPALIWLCLFISLAKSHFVCVSLWNCRVIFRLLILHLKFLFVLLTRAWHITKTMMYIWVSCTATNASKMALIWTLFTPASAPSHFSYPSARWQCSWRLRPVMHHSAIIFVCISGHVHFFSAQASLWRKTRQENDEKALFF
jgi:hypothetical protein